MKVNYGRDIIFVYLTLYRMGVGKREQCNKFVTQRGIRDWKNVKIMIFDAPQAIDKAYSERLQLLKYSKD